LLAIDSQPVPIENQVYEQAEIGKMEYVSFAIEIKTLAGRKKPFSHQQESPGVGRISPVRRLDPALFSSLQNCSVGQPANVNKEEVRSCLDSKRQAFTGRVGGAFFAQQRDRFRVFDFHNLNGVAGQLESQGKPLLGPRLVFDGDRGRS
jgi:hypothetical protein